MNLDMKKSHDDLAVTGFSSCGSSVVCSSVSLDGVGLSSSYGFDCTVSLDKLQDEIVHTFTPKKIDSMILSQVYRNLDLMNRAIRVKDCGSFLEFHVNEHDKKLHTANFCKDRLCPMCNWRRSLKIFGQVSRIMDVLEKDGYQFLFLTLTVRNCTGEELADTVQTIYDGWRYFYNKNSIFKGSVVGSFRSLEVTRNHKTGLFHPHLHVVLVVRPDYFNGKNYIKQSKWADMWKKACNLDYIPIVDVRKILPDDSKGLAGAVAEVSKYAVKSSDMFRGGDMSEISDTVSVFLDSLSGRRLCGFTGVFSSVRKQLQLDDIENGNLVNIDEDNIRSDVATMIVRYSWRSGVYVRSVETVS